MTEQTHTPGPWAYTPHADELISPHVVVLDDNNACGDPECCGERTYYITVKPADARLIVSAPDLLVACNSLLDYLRGPTAWTQAQEDDLVLYVTSAIAKATGVNP